MLARNEAARAFIKKNCSRILKTFWIPLKTFGEILMTLCSFCRQQKFNYIQNLSHYAPDTIYFSKPNDIDTKMLQTPCDAMSK